MPSKEINNRSSGEVIRLRHLADGINKATLTIEKLLIHRNKQDEAENRGLLSSYIDTVERLTDLDVLSEVTI